jgi:hypothetical protein
MRLDHVLQQEALPMLFDLYMMQAAGPLPSPVLAAHAAAHASAVCAATGFQRVSSLRGK